MHSVKDILNNEEIVNFEKSHFIASVWRIHYKKSAFIEDIKSLLQVVMLFIKVLLLRTTSKVEITKKTIFIYARYNGSTSLGVLAPVVKNLNRVEPTLIDNINKKTTMEGVNRINLLQLISMVAKNRMFINIFLSIRLVSQLRRILRKPVNIELLYCYFLGLLLYDGMKTFASVDTGILVETDATANTRGLVMGCKAKGGKSFCLQHGTMADHQFPVFVDHYYIWGEHFVKEFLKYQCYENFTNLHPYGYPRMETMILEAGMGMVPDPKFDLLVISNTHGKIYEPYLEEFFRCIEKVIRDGMKVLVKLHPAEDIKNYSCFVDKDILDRLQFVKNEMSLLDATNRSRMCYMIDSAAVIEVLTLKKPILFLRSDIGCYPDYGCGIWVDSNNILRVISELQNLNIKDKMLQGQEAYFQKLVNNFGRGTQIISRDIQERMI